MKKLSLMDKILTPAILVAMIVGVVIGEFVPNVQPAFDTARFASVSAPIAVGLIVMMWPILTKVQYEALPRILPTRTMAVHILLSLFLNWIIAPFVMLAFAWATLPDLPTYRTGVIMVGLARCIAMVMVWNQLARGDANYCAILVVVNSILQIALYSPYAVWFVNIMGGAGTDIHVSYGRVAISVLIYLGIPLGAGLLTRALLLYFTSRQFLTERFLPVISPLAPLGLLYTVIVLFAYQGHHIIHNIGHVFRVIVPLVLYFTVMWAGTFAFVWWLGRRALAKGQRDSERWSYEMAVVQSFTAGSNNFELAIAVTIAVYGVGSDQALAATIGPLVEVPVLLALTWLALYLGRALRWAGGQIEDGDQQGANEARDVEASGAVSAEGGTNGFEKSLQVDEKSD
ncbi:arsenical-resistance protein ACR3 [Laetiporus sulphureus 93-53]|uniref:Arsenical-resistance protein ACR3 n=1 Tax=Laetiporus sulphureus 93-53 TaxID=1314785 RepID=A0A165F4H3_9APHY|nr:arsenical-resistance protein ACR3 [Laetiporus sulphureus 93-53]KZT08368.1 arsenical-resistance protein ACR3 [Laetiporus sulphureus 93-53]